MNTEEFLQSRGVDYESLPHASTYAASHLASALHEPGDYVAKTVVLKADGQYVLAVIPSSYNIELELARFEIGCEPLAFAHEEELADLFPDCELGAIPPFGSLHDLTTWVDSRLTEDDYIVFETESHHDAVRISYADFEDLEQPRVADLASHP